MGDASLPLTFLSVGLVNLFACICLEKNLFKESDFEKVDLQKRLSTFCFGDQYLKAIIKTVLAQCEVVCDFFFPFTHSDFRKRTCRLLNGFAC